MEKNAEIATALLLTVLVGVRYGIGAYYKTGGKGDMMREISKIFKKVEDVKHKLETLQNEVGNKHTDKLNTEIIADKFMDILSNGLDSIGNVYRCRCDSCKYLKTPSLCPEKQRTDFIKACKSFDPVILSAHKDIVWYRFNKLQNKLIEIGFNENNIDNFLSGKCEDLSRKDGMW